MWGLIDSVQKGKLLLILGTETTVKGQGWTCFGSLGLAINMRPNYPNRTHYSTTLRLWSCGELTHVTSARQCQVGLDAMPGPPLKASVYLDPFARLSCTLEIISNMWYQSDFLMFLLSMFISFLEWWSTDVQFTIDLESRQRKNFGISLSLINNIFFMFYSFFSHS